MSLVLDCSATLAWVFPAETTPVILALFERIIDQGVYVPELWRIEVANCLTLGLRRGRITVAERDATLADLSNLPVLTDDETGRHIWGDTLKLADRHNLTAYDAIYLELALRRSLPLATLDQNLRKAGQRQGVELLGK